MVCIIDDREDVWSYASNLIHVKPYHFFKHTGDINAPPGLEKHENDEKEGVDLTNFKSKPNVEKITDGKNNRLPQVRNDDKLDNVTDEEIVLKKKDDECETQIINNKKSIPTADRPIEKKALGTNLNGKTETDEVEASNEKVETVEIDNKLKENTTRDNHIEDNPKEEIKEQMKESCEESQENKSALNSSLNLTEIEDSDDYLLYLEDILRRIHQAFYDEYDKMESGEVPDLKKVIPAVKGRVLKGCKMIFSGLVPTHIKLEHSRAYQVARSLGAEVCIYKHSKREAIYSFYNNI